MSRPAVHSAEDLLAAAERVVARLGAGGLSFDAVAREAGVSKGAVLHYFRTKDALVAAMVRQLVERLAPKVSAGPDVSGAEAIALVIDAMRRTPGDKDAASTALLAAVVQDLSSLRPLRDANRIALDRLADVFGGAYAAQLLHFALDGLWLSEVLGISPLSEEERAALFERLSMDMLLRHQPIP